MSSAPLAPSGAPAAPGPMGLPHDIHGLMPAQLPLWQVILATFLAGLALALVGWGVRRLWRGRPRTALPEDPWDRLKAQHAQLTPRAPFPPGREQEEFFFELSLLVRAAIELKTGFPAVGRTVQELRGVLAGRLPLTKSEGQALTAFLERADMVKFAGAPSDLTEAVAAHGQVGQWLGRLTPASPLPAAAVGERAAVDDRGGGRR